MAGSWSAQSDFIMGKLNDIITNVIADLKKEGQKYKGGIRLLWFGIQFGVCYPIIVPSKINPVFRPQFFY